MDRTSRTPSRIPFQNMAIGLAGSALLAAPVGVMMLTPAISAYAEKSAISATGAVYYTEIMRKCPSLEPQVRMAIADFDADRTEILRMNAYVRTARSIVGERSCDVKPIDLDRRDTGPLVL